MKKSEKEKIKAEAIDKLFKKKKSVKKPVKKLTKKTAEKKSKTKSSTDQKQKELLEVMEAFAVKENFVQDAEKPIVDKKVGEKISDVTSGDEQETMKFSKPVAEDKNIIQEAEAATTSEESGLSEAENANKEVTEEKTKLESINMAMENIEKENLNPETDIAETETKNTDLEAETTTAKNTEADMMSTDTLEMGEDQLFTGEDSTAKKIGKKIFVVIIVLACIGAIGVGSFYLYNKYFKNEAIQVNKKAEVVVPTEEGSAVKNDEEKKENDLEIVRAAIAKLIELPNDEDPIVATVTDVDKIKTQQFFTKAQNGDRVLIYNKNKKAILYRPSINKLIEVSQVSGADVNLADENQVAQSSNENSELSVDEKTVSTETTQNKQTAISAESPAKVAIYNGSKINGLAQKIGEIVALIPEAAVMQKINASGNYEKTLIIDISGNHNELVKKIAESLGGEVSTLPEGETKPASDILIIGGSSFEIK